MDPHTQHPRRLHPTLLHQDPQAPLPTLPLLAPALLTLLPQALVSLLVRHIQLHQAALPHPVDPHILPRQVPVVHPTLPLAVAPQVVPATRPRHLQVGQATPLHLPPVVLLTHLQAAPAL